MEIEMLKKCTRLWREAMSKCAFGPLLTLKSRFAWQVQGILHLAKSLKKVGVGHLKRFYKDASRVAGEIQETHESDTFGGPGADFLTGGLHRYT